MFTFAPASSVAQIVSVVPSIYTARLTVIGQERNGATVPKYSNTLFVASFVNPDIMLNASSPIVVPIMTTASNDASVSANNGVIIQSISWPVVTEFVA